MSTKAQNYDSIPLNYGKIFSTADAERGRVIGEVMESFFSTVHPLDDLTTMTHPIYKAHSFNMLKNALLYNNRMYAFV